MIRCNGSIPLFFLFFFFSSARPSIVGNDTYYLLRECRVWGRAVEVPSDAGERERKSWKARTCLSGRETVACRHGCHSISREETTSESMPRGDDSMATPPRRRLNRDSLRYTLRRRKMGSPLVEEGVRWIRDSQRKAYRLNSNSSIVLLPTRRCCCCCCCYFLSFLRVFFPSTFSAVLSFSFSFFFSLLMQIKKCTWYAYRAFKCLD